jgi:hypothetical protein
LSKRSGTESRGTPSRDRASGSRPLGLSVGSRKVSWRVVAFIVLCLLAIAVAVGYAAIAGRRAESAARAALAEPAASPEVLAALRAEPHLLFLQTQGDPYRRLAAASLDADQGSRYLVPLECQRIHFAAGRGLCVGEKPFGGAFTFDEDFKRRSDLQANGLPSRARVSPDGRYGSMTVFVQGHSYAEGGFSTQTILVDMATGQPLADLEQFAVFKDGARFESPDFNFWGVTFARDSNRFYATLGTGGTTYLVDGDVGARQLRVVRENVECPSLSPDNTRLVFKKRTSSLPGPVIWRLHALDLATGVETPLAEIRSVDDQAEWLDDNTVVYFLQDEGPPATIRPDLWTVATDGSGTPRLLRTGAFSPAVIRP